MLEVHLPARPAERVAAAQVREPIRRRGRGANATHHGRRTGRGRGHSRRRPHGPGVGGDARGGLEQVVQGPVVLVKEKFRLPWCYITRLEVVDDGQHAVVEVLHGLVLGEAVVRRVLGVVVVVQVAAGGRIVRVGTGGPGGADAVQVGVVVVVEARGDNGEL